MFLINGKEISFNKTKKRTGKKKQNQKTPRTFDDLGDPAKPVAAKKISPPFFIAFPLTENNVVQSWFTKVMPSSL